MLVGVGVFGASWGASALNAILSGNGYYAIPIGGAFYSATQQLSKAQHACDVMVPGMSCDTPKIIGIIGTVSGVLYGVAQAAGLVLTIIGVSTKKPTEVPDRPTVRLTPLTEPAGAGVGLAGEF